MDSFFIVVFFWYYEIAYEIHLSIRLSVFLLYLRKLTELNYRLLCRTEIINTVILSIHISMGQQVLCTDKNELRSKLWFHGTSISQRSCKKFYSKIYLLSPILAKMAVHVESTNYEARREQYCIMTYDIKRFGIFTSSPMSAACTNPEVSSFNNVPVVSISTMLK